MVEWVKVLLSPTAEFNLWDPRGERGEPALHMCAVAFACHTYV